MSRKHAPLPLPDWMAEIVPIRRRLNELLDAGETPVAIVLGPEIHARQRKAAGGRWDEGWADLFDYTVERGRDEGWSVRVKARQPPEPDRD